MAKEKEDLIAERTFHVSVAKGDMRTFHGLNSNVQDIVPEEFYEAAERRGVKLVPRKDAKKAKEELKPKNEATETIYNEEDLKTKSKGDLTSIMLSREVQRRDIEKKKSDIIKQILDSNKEKPKEEQPE